MCILCVIQKWSRRVATMLPWLVIPLIGLWALSQLLPPDFRFEITSPRLACVSVLLVTLFWYEFLMPQLSAWRVRRNARLRERERLEAIEFDKLRKTATRCCRNCLTPYRDQNPAGSRFMCSYCGHISKRPVLDLPVMPGMRVSNSGIMKELLGKGGKMPSGKWSENGWVCGQDWLENCNWPSCSFVGKPTYWRGYPGMFFPRDNQCLAEKSYSRIVIFACKLLASFFLNLKWLWRKIFRTSTSGDNNSLDAERREILAKRAYNGASFQESRGEKARRKAEEKRQARLERELLEEEERKQREEVARLVEERRRLRDEKMGAEKDRRKGSVSAKEKESKKGAEKRRQEKRKDKDKNSSKSNSDVEELEKRAGKENEKKREPDKKSEIDRREHQKIGTESVKNPSIEGRGLKVNALNGYNRGNAGTRYLDCMRGTFLSSSKAFSGGSIFGKSSNTADITASKENKSNGFVNHGQASINRRESCVPEHLAGKVGMNRDEKNTHHPVVSDPLPAPRKSWQQLFTRSTAAVPPSLNVNVISRPNAKSLADCQRPQLANQSQLTQSFETPINFGLPSPFTLPTIQNGCSSSAGFPSATNSIFPCLGEAPCDILPEEPDIFEDPCYDPDPVSLLGPVSESLENFQMDLGIERPHGLKNVSATSEFSRPSAIESPISRLQILDDRHANSNRVHTPRAQDVHTSSIDDSSNTNEKGTWQMWNASPLVHNGLGLVGGAANWLVPAELNRSNKEDAVHPSSHRTMESLFTKEEQAVSGIHSQKLFPCNGQNSGMFSSFSRSSDHDPWAQSAFSQPSSGGENHFYLNPLKETTGNQTIHGSPRVSVVNHPFDYSSTDSWPKNEWAVQDSGETAGSTPVARPHIGGLYTNPNVQSLWSYA